MDGLKVLKVIIFPMISSTGSFGLLTFLHALWGIMTMFKGLVLANGREFIRTRDYMHSAISVVRADLETEFRFHISQRTLDAVHQMSHTV